MALGRNASADLVATAALNFVCMTLCKLCVLQYRVMSGDSVRVLLPEDRSGLCPRGVEGGTKNVLTVLHCSQGQQLEAMI
jgi:hypothetical protein